MCVNSRKDGRKLRHEMLVGYNAIQRQQRSTSSVSIALATCGICSQLYVSTSHSAAECIQVRITVSMTKMKSLSSGHQAWHLPHEGDIS